MIKPLCCGLLATASLALSGCGSIQIYNEANLYHRELDDLAAQTLAKCRAGEKTSMTQNRDGSVPDCFDLVVKQSPKRIGVRPGTADIRDGDRRLPPVSDDAYAYIDQFALMALFSKMVYHRFQDEKIRSSAAACRHDADRHPLRSLYDDASKNGRWQLWKNGAEGCHAEGGLFMETYVHYPAGAAPDDDQYTHAVIVFRGTENGQTQRTADWGANLSTAFGFEPKQYVAAARYVDAIVAALHAQRSPALPIYAAGHSLGGGLAQMAAYWNKGIDASYAFNSTPVTGWTWVHAERRKAGNLEHMNGDPTIYRVSQRSEALHALRAISTAVNSERFGRSDFDFDFRIDKTPDDASRREKFKAAADQHDIGLLACHMAARVALGHRETGDTAAFDYSADMALKALRQNDKLDADSLGNASLCSSDTLTTVRKAVCAPDKPYVACLAASADIAFP